MLRCEGQGFTVALRTMPTADHSAVGEPLPGDSSTTRMFDTELFERFSRVHPATPFVFWVPVTAFVLYRSASRGDLRALGIVGVFLLGMFAWSFAEYVLHRGIFHWSNDTAFGRRVHFLLHGVHHDYPDDKGRLMMPLGASIPLGVVFYALFTFTMHARFGEPFFAGFVIGYLFYDGTHYFVHHFRPKSRWGKLLRRHHMTHHFADHDGGFGVSSPLWDYVFRTVPKKREKGANLGAASR
jgi:sterol desaturase/sphingolipid hydroxylase (fatty acid hydroxylase superfamily)